MNGQRENIDHDAAEAGVLGRQGRAPVRTGSGIAVVLIALAVGGTGWFWSSRSGNEGGVRY